MEKLGWVQITAFPDLSVRKWKNWTEKSVKKNYLCVDLLHSQTAVTEREREIASNEIVCPKFTIIKRMISHFEI